MEGCVYVCVCVVGVNGGWKGGGGWGGTRFADGDKACLLVDVFLSDRLSF